MASKLNPYLNFGGNARQALEFYQTVFGGKLDLSTFSSVPGMPSDPAEANNIMHGQLDAPNGFTLMGADMPKAWGTLNPGNAYSVSLSGDDQTELRGYWDRLSEGATIGQALMAAPWGDTFGMLTDKFGIMWLFNIAGKPQ